MCKEGRTHTCLSAQTNADALASVRRDWVFTARLQARTCKHTHKHTHLHALAPMCAQIRTSTHICIHAYLRTSMHAYMCTSMRARTHTRTHTNTHSYALILNLYMRTYTYACLHMSARARTLCSKARDRGRLSHPRHCLWFRTCNLRCHPDVLRHLAPMSDPLAHMVWLYLPLSSCLPCLIVPPASSS